MSLLFLNFLAFFLIPAIVVYLMADFMIWQNRTDRYAKDSISIWSFALLGFVFVPFFGPLFSIVFLICEGYITKRLKNTKLHRKLNIRIKVK